MEEDTPKKPQRRDPTADKWEANSEPEGKVWEWDEQTARQLSGEAENTPPAVIKVGGRNMEKR